MNIESYEDAFNRVKARKEGAFIPFIVAGDPDFETSIKIVKTFVEKVESDFPKCKLFILSPDIRDEHPEYNSEMKKFLKKHPEITLEQLMKNTNFQKILNDSKYFPD